MNAAALLLALASASASPNVEDSVAILYGQNTSGGMEMICTATAFERQGELTRFLTAAHCVTEPSSEVGVKLKVTETPLFLSKDDKDTKKYIRANVVEVGREEKGYDYAIVSAKMGLPLTPLGDERTEASHVEVINVAAPAGLGLVSFQGQVALKYIDRPLIENEINWRESMLVTVPAEGGSSGSAIVSRDTGKIIGILVGRWRSLVIGIPASRVKSRASDMVLYPQAKKLVYEKKAADPVAGPAALPR